MKQETLEEFINQTNTPEGLDQFSYDKGLEDGSKWQQEQNNKLYSEEEVREAVNWKAVYEESLNMQKCSNAGFLSKINELKEQIKTMYSEKDMIAFAEFIAKHPDKNKNVSGEMLHAKSKYDSSERTIDLLQEWIEQFKKK
jgi:hypothetical protein